MSKMRFLKPTELPSTCSSAMAWVVLPDYPSFAVSECGDVVRISDSRRIKGSMDYDGYPSYSLTNKDGVRKHVAAHRLVALGFLGDPPSPGMQVAHKNGSRLMCHKDNLRWSTPLQNHDDRRDHGNGFAGERNAKAKLSDEDVREIRRLHAAIKMRDIDMKVYELADMYGLHIGTVCNIAARKSWTHIE